MIRNPFRIAVFVVLAIALAAIVAGCGGSGGSVVPPPPPPPPAQPPSITTQPTSQTVAVGVSATFSVVATGTSPLSYQWRKDGTNIAGATSASFTIASVAMSDAGNYTVVVSNSAGSATSNAATLTVNQPAPVITEVTPETLWCNRECAGPPFAELPWIIIRGSNFTTNDTVTISHGTILQGEHTSSTEKRMSVSFGSLAWSPGWVTIVISGSGGTTTSRFAFLGNLNTLAISNTHAFQLDQGAGKVHRFRLSDGAKDLEWGAGRLTYHLAIDEQLGRLLTFQSNRFFIVWDFDGQNVGGNTNGSILLAGASRGGHGCISQDIDDQIVSVDLSQINPSMVAASIGDQPHSVAMTNILGQLVCVVYNREDNVLSVVDIPSMNLRGFVFLAGLTKASMVSTAQGGWQLGVFHSGSSAGKAVLLAQADKKLAVVDLNTNPLQELRRIDLSGFPFRIATNDADGSVIVAYVDVAAGLTRFEKINPNTGVVTSLSITSNLLCTGFGVSTDGTKLYCANRDQFQILNNQ